MVKKSVKGKVLKKGLSKKQKKDLEKSRKIESSRKKKEEELEMLQDLYVRELLNKISGKIVPVKRSSLRSENLEEEVGGEVKEEGSSKVLGVSYDSSSESSSTINPRNNSSDKDSVSDSYMADSKISEDYISGKASSVDPGLIRTKQERLLNVSDKRVGLEGSFRGSEDMNVQRSHTGEIMPTRMDPLNEAVTFVPENSAKEGYSVMSPTEDKKKYEATHG